MQNRRDGLAVAAAVLAGAAVLAASGPAEARNLLELVEGARFSAGYEVPLMRPGNLLAFLAVGLWAARWGGGAIWQMPAAAAVGAVLGSLVAGIGVQIPYLDQALAATLVILGLVVALPVPIPYPVLAVGLLAGLHGAPHPAEGSGDPISFWGGLACGSLLAASAGIGATGIVSHFFGGIAVRACGLAIAAFGALILMDRL